MEPCKYCGSEIVFEKQRLTGTCRFYLHIDPERQQEVDDLYLNSDMYDYLDHKSASEYYWCARCNKKLYKIKES